MKNTAVVLAVRGGRAVILADGGVFQEVPDRHYAVGQVIDRPDARPRSLRLLRRGLLAAACLTLIASSALAAARFVPWTYVDVALGESSVRYCLNLRNQVLSVQTAADLQEAAAAAPYEPIGTALERTLTALRQEADPEVPVQVEIASRFGAIQSAQQAVTEALGAAGTDSALRQVPWGQTAPPQPPQAQPQAPEANLLPEAPEAPMADALPLQPEAPPSPPSAPAEVSSDVQDALRPEPPAQAFQPQEPPAQEPPVQETPAQETPIQEPPAQQPSAQEAPAQQPPANPPQPQAENRSAPAAQDAPPAPPSGDQAMPPSDGAPQNVPGGAEPMDPLLPGAPPPTFP